MSHLPGLPLVYGVAMGIGAMTVVMLRLPLTSVLLATVLLSSDGLQVTPLAIVAVVVAYVASARLTPTPRSGTGRRRGCAAAGSAVLVGRGVAAAAAADGASAPMRCRAGPPLQGKE